MDRNLIKTQTQSGDLTEKDISTLIQAGILPHGVPTSQVNVFAAVCKELKLSPFAGDIYLLGYKTRDGSMLYSRIVGIQGYRKIAKRDPAFAGVTEAIYNQMSDGSYSTAAELILKKELPITATVTCYKMVEGQKMAFTHTAVFREFNTGKQKWGEMPFQMIAKVAESFAYRKAFTVSGVHIEEEIGALTGEVATEPEINDHKMIDIKVAIAKCKTRAHFEKLLKDNPEWKNSSKILDLMTERNQQIQNENTTTGNNK